MKATWHKTTCVLCEQNCGLKVQVLKNRIVTVLPDENHLISKGYICRKGLHIADHQHHKDRLTHPLKKTSQGFEPISWTQAFSEISRKLKPIIERNPTSFAFMGGMNKGCHMDAVFGKAFLNRIGSPYHYHSIAQEHTGWYWIMGKMLGRQDCLPITDEQNSDMILAVGWDGTENHQIPRAPIALKSFATHPQKRLVVIDHRITDTAKIADAHICIQPGTDALLVKSLIAIILKEGWEDKTYINTHVDGLNIIHPWFKEWDVPSALKICGVTIEAVYVLCHELCTRQWCLKIDKGTLMNRHSTISTYLYMILLAICGRICMPGGNVIPGYVFPITNDDDEKKKTIYTNHPSIGGFYPPNILPEEINNADPNRIKSLLVCGANPIRSYADTQAYEKAFKKLELLIVIDIAFTETAQMADYVLPASSAYESWDTVFYGINFPHIFFQIRQPVLKPESNTKECGEIITLIAEAMGLLPEIPDALIQAAHQNRYHFLLNLLAFSQKASEFESALPFVLSKTLGQSIKSSHCAALWGLFHIAESSFRKRAEAVGFKMQSAFFSNMSLKKLFAVGRSIISHLNLMPVAGLFPRVKQSEMIFQTLCDNPSGISLGEMPIEQNLNEIQTSDGCIHLYIPELSDWLQSIIPSVETIRLRRSSAYPMVLIASRSAKTNAQNQIRKPDWNKGLRFCTIRMNSFDADQYNFTDGQNVRVVTPYGSSEIALEISNYVQKGQVIIPHGSGLKYQGKSYGVNVNYLTGSSNRDPFSGIPIHQYIPCRVESVF